MIKSRRVLASLVRVAMSAAVAVVFLGGWANVFIPVFKLANDPLLTAVGWLSAPLVMAAGIAVGYMIGDRLTKIR